MRKRELFPTNWCLFIIGPVLLELVGAFRLQPLVRRQGASSLLRRRETGREPLSLLRGAQGEGEDPQFRVGHGYDIHRLAPGLTLTIGGIDIPYEKGTEAHSDGDVVFHSLCDAIFGALSLPDIGQQFPDTDPRWKGAASCVFMEEAFRQMDERGYRIGNADVTLILERPKVKDFKPKMVDRICELLRAPHSRVNVKARTHEKVDSVGESRALECHVVVVLEKKP
uniref:2-C-methyl-D-erythritol 2,4-cyclodiphosphate synthase n=1 Tax=Chromera velia CCMP2878 TaxID=1169474 RepID=A0A0G4H9P7_9ALVE|eukprot:Cvel_25386.t1-p1 / transcript=Cvel_25386.t1 / gene=Cvel_25386 / organism=Chromera_velia_CCMP2878 / gene_product=2-C-methyl-D-erythritol 2,4-cyclodiphosphate, putative / transcript_product=2-C-methyl-D-erythritol 2,4-cyclodiphosphate, putative / location=Cvel_scaffold2869:13959-16492(-) / protein_length=224 / sequence_SO=supercontig / SO=protein_coding / is_pseudo=false